jgi:hypothetical protein
MNNEQKIRNEAVERSRKSEVGSRKMAEAISSCPPLRGVRGASFIAVGFSQRTADANSPGLQPHILKMWLKPAAENIEYRISNIESGSFGNKVVPHFLFLISYFLFLPMWLKPAAENTEYRISNIESGCYAPIKVTHSLFLISYFLFLPMWLKPGAENIEYRISNIESGSYAPIKVTHFLFLISYSFFLPMWLKPVAENTEYRILNIESGCYAPIKVTHSLFLILYFILLNNSTICLPAPLSPLKGSARCKEVVAGFVRGISPIGVRGSAGIGMTNTEFQQFSIYTAQRSSTTPSIGGGRGALLTGN